MESSSSFARQEDVGSYGLQKPDVHGIDEKDVDCHYEWLVKWTGLDYSHATWELENASFLMSPEAVKLMTDYEIRHQQSKKELHPLREDEVVLFF